jgi:predicted RNase H-like HicB family nuclease
MQYAIVIERSSNGFGAYVPDLPGCVAVAESEEEVRELIREAIEFHLESLREDDDPIPQPTAQVDYVEVPHAA